MPAMARAGTASLLRRAADPQLLAAAPAASTATAPAADEPGTGEPTPTEPVPGEPVVVRTAAVATTRDRLAPIPPAPVLAASPATNGADGRPSCTVAQLRRFIKSRPWVPMHELRRRFGIVGTEDDVTPIRVGDHQLFVGLPAAEGGLMAELLAGGDVGYELSLDPGAPVVVGVYPMRPVPRS